MAAALAAVVSQALIVSAWDEAAAGTAANVVLLLAAYVRRSGAVWQPRVTSFRARIHSRIRPGPDKPWMRFTAEQVNTYGAKPSRLFLMDATMFGLPVDVLHTFVGSDATMRAKVCSLVPVLNVSGHDMA